ncbi:MAG: M23 family metallopeptidase, partial [Thermodesulfobacteriota bacterium]
LKQGGVALFSLDGGSKKHELSASFSGGEVFTIKDRTGTWGLIAADLQTKPGSYQLTFKNDKKEVLKEMEIVYTDYGSESFNLPKDMVELSTEDLARVGKETALLRGLWATSNEKPLWEGPFIMPIDGRLSAKFGLRRTMNNIPRSPHSGMDIAAPKGTPVMAANNGKVAFIGNFFFNGKFIVLDHGLGVFTVYAHLDKIMAKSGEIVEKGSTIGEVGSTGRSTGPHLHFGVKVGRMRVSPAELFELLSES